MGGSVTSKQLETASLQSRLDGRSLGVTLIDLGFIDDRSYAAAASTASGLTLIDLHRHTLDAEATSLLDAATARRLDMLPLQVTDRPDAPVERRAVRGGEQR